MKKLLAILAIFSVLGLSSCSENYANGNLIGTVTNFKKSGALFKSWEGHLNVTQTGMNTAHGFDFSIDNDNEPAGLVATLDSAQQQGWKVELTYHQVYGKNWFSNRGHTDYFVTACRIEDRKFSANGYGNNLFGGNSQTSNQPVNYVATKDTVVQIVVTLDEARKAGWIK